MGNKKIDYNKLSLDELREMMNDFKSRGFSFIPEHFNREGKPSERYVGLPRILLSRNDLGSMSEKKHSELEEKIKTQISEAVVYLEILDALNRKNPDYPGEKPN